MDDHGKVRCRICGWELNIELPFSEEDEELMEQHVRSHDDCSGDAFEPPTTDDVIAEELERWYSHWHGIER